MVKKKQQDFQKIKLKVGRKLVKGTNVTNTDFKTKKIVLRESKFMTKDPVATLVTSGTASTQVKLLCLNKLSSGTELINADLVTGELMNALAKYLIDPDYRIRVEAIKCIKVALKSLERKSDTITPMLSLLLTYIKCGLSHINPSIIKDSRKLLGFIIEKSDLSLNDQLMSLMLDHFKNKQPDASDFELCLKLLEIVIGKEKLDKVNEDEMIPEFRWSPTNCSYDLVAKTFKGPSLHFNLSFPNLITEDMKELFFNFITKIVYTEAKSIFSTRNFSGKFTTTEAKKTIAILKICKILQLELDFKKCSQIDITINVESTFKHDKGNKLQSSINHMKKELNDLILNFVN